MMQLLLAYLLGATTPLTLLGFWRLWGRLPQAEPIEPVHEAGPYCQCFTCLCG